MVENEERARRCCFTGHRPEKLNLAEKTIMEALHTEIQAAIADGFTTFLSGMARGVDLWAAQLVLEQKQIHPELRLICVVPYEGVETSWSLEWQRLYHDVLTAADGIKVVSPHFTYDVFQMRNRWMVEHSSRVIAAYNGAKGGTKNTIKYAEQQGVTVRMVSA